MLLELKNVKKYFPVRRGFWGESHESVRAVDGVDLTIARGENLGLVGESGSGKTTLGRIILKLLPVDSGDILFEGTDITHLSARQLRRIRKNFQMVFQDPYSSLDPRFTIKNIIQEAMIFDEKGMTRLQQEDRVRELLLAVKLPEDVAGRFPHEFSGGERQRIAIARALARSPKLLILDEAVSSLDVLIQEQITDLFKDLQKKFSLTYFFISHNLRVVKRISAKIAVMYQGKIVEIASTSELFHNPLHRYTQALLTAAMHYKVSTTNQEISLDERSRLIDQGNGHWVRQ